MARALLMLGMLAVTVSPVSSTVDDYPPRLTRETLVGTWEGVVGLGLHGSHPIVFHIQIAPRNEDSYMAEIYPEHLGGFVFRLQVCTVTDGKVYLRFQELPGGIGREWWIEGEGYGDAKTAWLEANVGTGLNARGSGGAPFYFAKGTWVRNFGEASRRGEEKIAEAKAAKK
jgi:hypothetical protein